MGNLLICKSYSVASRGDGILNNLTNKVVILLWVLLSSCSNLVQVDPISCAKDSIGKKYLVKIDESQKRFFITQENLNVEELKMIIRNVGRCLSHHTWSKKWSLSVFSDKKLAGYKDDPQVIRFHKDEEWTKGYLAEYDSVSGRLILNPVFKPMTSELK